MDIKRILYVSQQIAPYLSENEFSLYGRDLPRYIQEKGKEVRLFMPKFGCINERRNQLHEVIRLSGKNITINDMDHPLLIKVATLQPYRMQVYFIDNEDYFRRYSVKEMDTKLSPAENDERIIFFTDSVAATAIKLRWIPQVIHCTGWMSALVPMYLRKKYADDPAFVNSKIVFSLDNDDFEGELDPQFISKLKENGLDVDENTLSGRDFISITKLAIDFCDAVIQSSENVVPELVEYAKASGKPFLSYSPLSDDSGEKVNQFYHSL